MKRTICIIMLAALLFCACAEDNAPIGYVAAEDEMTDVEQIST